MKPRLPAAPLTQEDQDIWFIWLWREPFKPYELQTLSQPQDERDADLMLQAQQEKHVCSYWWPWISTRVSVRGGNYWRRPKGAR